jgi:hypothetical protein
VELTDAELEEIRGMNATAAIVMHYGGDDWSRAQINSLETQFKEMNIEPISTTDVDFDPGKQVSDLETVQARDPDIIVSIPTDPVATADAYKAVAEDGVELVFMDNVPDGFEQGEDYVSVVSADNFGNGVVSAHLMADRLGGQGKVGVVFHNADFFVTRQQLASGGIVQGQRVGCPLQRCEHAQIKFYVLLVSGTVAALAGMLYAGRLHSGRFQWGEGDELSVIAAVILGGTSLFGGYGTVIGSVLGALLIGLINNGLTLMGLEFSQQTDRARSDHHPGRHPRPQDRARLT